MPIDVLMPALSPTMEEGKLAKWLVREGQAIKSGDVIAEIETDKATMEVEAVDEGIFGEILVAAGTEKVKVNTPIARLLAHGEPAQAKYPPVSAPATEPGNIRQSAAVSAQSVVENALAVANAQTTKAIQPAALSRDQPLAAAHAGSVQVAVPLSTSMPSSLQTATRIFASPLARRLAAQANLDLTLIAGTGPHGRIIQADVDQALHRGVSRQSPQHPDGQARGVGLQVTARQEDRTPSEAPRAPGMPPAGALVPSAVAMADDKVLALFDKASYDVIPHDGMRSVIAQRLTLSKQSVPHFYMTVECRLDNLLAARERINLASPKTGPKTYKLSVNDFVIKAWGLALQRVPQANATWTEAGMLRHRHSDVGVAVSVEGGLFTPIVRHVELKTLGDISNEMKDLSDRARKKRLAPHEYQGGTTSISNLGMYGISSFDAVINPPHATIIAVGAGERKPIVTANGQIEVATLMNVTLSCDHRVVDGALGAEVLNAFKALIEDPVRMLV